MAHRTSIDVRFNEIDPYGHVNHAVYVTYCEVGRTDALTACGIPLEAMAARGYQLVVTRIDVRFRSPAGAGDALVVETELSSMRRASGTWSQRVLRPRPDGTEEILVTAEVTAAVTDDTGRPTRPPEWLFPAMASLLPAGDDREPANR